MRIALLASLFGLVASTACAGRLVEPSLHVSAADKGGLNVALTFDACDGTIDDRILTTLIDNRMPATIFVTGKWLRRNPAAIAILKAHPDLFQIEDHGARHIPAIDTPTRIYGLAAAGSPAAVEREVKGGADAIVAAGFAKPQWFRGATAKYTAASMGLIRRDGLKVAGFSVNGDAGAILSARSARARIGRAKDGDVIIAHINQPRRPAGAGVVEGLIDLKRRGAHFFRLGDIATTETPAM